MARRSNVIVPPGMKYCPRCKGIKLRRDFNGGYCTDCHRAYHRKWMAENNYDVIATLRAEAVRRYGGSCRACRENDPRVLDVYPQTSRNTRTRLYAIKNAHYPPGYYVLCANCAIKELDSEDAGSV